MERKKKLMEQFAAEANLELEAVPGVPLVEISGLNRVLIENHLGVKAYSREKIQINVKYGCICVSGQGLELARMTREQLVICGNVECVVLLRKGHGER